MIENADSLVKLQAELGRSEAAEIAARNRGPAGLLAFGAAMAAIGLLAGIPVLLVSLLPWRWEIALGWVLVYAVVGVALAVIGRSRLELMPRVTLRTLEETEQWFVQQVRSFER